MKTTIASFRSLLSASTKTNLTSPVISWLRHLQKEQTGAARLVPLQSLTDWRVNAKSVHHIRGNDHFFAVRGISVTNARHREVTSWNQPIFVQKEGGVLAILCQSQKGTVRFLLQARFEPGNIGGVQLGPTIQATQSNLKQHHKGTKPRFSEYLHHPKTTIVYSAKHSEEGARFYRKSNTNMLIFLDPTIRIKLAPKDNYIWLTLGQIKALMLHDHIVNPFVKTILAPL